MNFSRPLNLILKPFDQWFFVDECITEILIHLKKNFWKIPIRKWIRGKWIFSHL
jgi:hypothetical protein